MPPATPLHALAARWAKAKPAERANAQTYIIELCTALGVEPPRPAAEDGHHYSFEFPLKAVASDGSESTNFIDCYKAGHFALEAKSFQGEDSEDRRLRRAFAQVRSYALQLPGDRPPYIMVLDVGKSLLVWDRWSGDYGGFNAALRVDLPSLGDKPDELGLLRDIWENPGARDTSARAAQVTKRIAERLAQLAASLEGRGHPQEEVARFLIRVVFTMFAEDVDLLAPETFRNMIADVPVAELPEALEDLWRSMDKGLRFGGRKLARFNGHFFHDSKSLPLTTDDQALLLLAANAEWQDVEPSIFGTLLVRALDPVERHRLGAEFTPREFVERVVRPTVEEPVRERWNLVQAEVLQLRETGKDKDRKAALKAVQDFHAWLCGLQILDPACGSGNFLYVTLHLLKRIELEVKSLENDLRKGGDADFRLFEVHPRQFHGIEVKPWAREIAELTLWIGYHQFWKQHEHVQYPEPILEDTGTIECRDAVLAWDSIRHDPTRDRPDPTPRIPHPVTGELVPDSKVKLKYMEYLNPRPAEWPRVDFIVGNPPYLGKGRQREGLGDGYVDALRNAYQWLPDGVDLVLYWWHRAAEAVRRGDTTRAGLITTNSITQTENRSVIEHSLGPKLRLGYAIADHPWVDDADGAAVRVAITVLAGPGKGARVGRFDGATGLLNETAVSQINTDLGIGPDLPATCSQPLLANSGLTSVGFSLFSTGFQVEQVQAARLRRIAKKEGELLRPYIGAKDVTDRSRGLWVLDFGMRDIEEARRFPVLLDYVRDHVKPERDANKRKAYREYWWRFGEPRRELREGIERLNAYWATPRTAKHRVFVRLAKHVAPDEGLVCFFLADSYLFGVLSSRLHIDWATAVGGTLEDRPRYNKTLCFEPFPFPISNDHLSGRIASKLEEILVHRDSSLARDERVTMTKTYNVVEKLRIGEALTPAERTVHELAACGVLKDLHEELDGLVADAYGWPWPMEKEEILERLVKLHDERVAEEKAGKVRWLRPEYQIPRFGKGLAAPAELALEADGAAGGGAGATEPLPWPKTAMEQLGGLKTLLGARALSVEEAAAGFTGASRALVERHLEALALTGEVTRGKDGKYQVG